MDRMVDSGSTDWGSTPHGCTKKNANFQKLAFVVYAHFAVYLYFCW